MIKIVDIYKEKDRDKKLQLLEQRKHELLQRENRKDKIYQVLFDKENNISIRVSLKTP